MYTVYTLSSAVKQMGTEVRIERVALTRETVVEAALARADIDGLEALSLRRVAGDLGVTPMALYNYVASKEELLEAMTERAFGEFELLGPAQVDDAGWQDQLRCLARAFRRLLIRHPALAEGEAKGLGLPSAAGLRIVDVLLGILRGAGFTVEQAALLHDKLERFVVALVVLERQGGARTPEDQEERRRLLRARLLTLPPEPYRNVIEATDYLCAPADPAAAFELALDLLIAGLEVLVAS